MRDRLKDGPLTQRPAIDFAEQITGRVKDKEGSRTDIVYGSLIIREPHFP